MENIKDFCRSANKVLVSFAVMILTPLIFINIGWAATYYMPDDFPSLQAAFAGMSGGDTLIIRDGTYTGPSNMINTFQKPPAGSASGYTIIRAEHEGKVIFDGEMTNNPVLIFGDGDTETFTLRYVEFRGLIWKNSKGNVVAIYGGTHHVKFIKCGAAEPGSANDVCFTVSRRNEYDPHDILFEDCFAWGSGHYKFLVYHGHRIILRRCLARFDYVGDTTWPKGGFAIYGSDSVEVQNCLAIDGDTRALWANNTNQVDGAFYTPNNSEYSTNVFFRGCMALNWDMPFSGTRGDEVGSAVFENCVGWETWSGDSLSRARTSYNKNTFGKFKKPSSPAFNGYGGTTSMTNSIFFGISTNVINLYETVDNNCFYNCPTYTPGTNPIENINPLANSLLYLPRIEPGSDLSNAGSNGGSVGATIMKRIGVSGTLYGENGYNTVTTENLWPWPNEDIIREAMKAYNLHGVNGARGFCADGQTLTKYIWEYLGNPIPPEIYGSQDNSAPHADAGQDQTVEDSDNNGSEAVTLDGSGSYDSDGSITSYSWTENGQSIGSGVNPSVTLSVGTHQIQLTVTDNEGATSEDTVQVVVTPPEGDNSPPVITNIQTSNISSQTVTITWVTDEPSSSSVEYGTSSSYGQAANSADLMTTHSVALSGLLPSTTYHYRVSSTDSSGNTSNSADFTFTTAASSVEMHTLQDFEDGVLWVPGGNQDPTGNGKGWAFLSTGDGDKIEIDNIGANGTHHSLKITFSSSNDTIYFRSDDKTRDHMPEAKGANRMSFYIRFPEGFPIQQLPFRYDTWQLGTFIHDPNDWNDTHRATSESDHGIHHYYHRFTIEKVGNGWVKYIINTHPDQANYSGSTVPPDRGSEYFDNFGRFYFHFGPQAGGPDPGRPFTIYIDEIKFYHDDGSVGGQVHTGGQNDAGFDGQFFPDSTNVSPPAPGNLHIAQ